MAADPGDGGGQTRRRGRAAADGAIGAAEQQAMVGGPARVVIRAPRVPQQDVGEADLAARARVERRCRRDVGVHEPEAAGKRPELARRVAGRDHPLPRLDDAAVGADADPGPASPASAAPDWNPPDRRSLEHPGPGAHGRTHDALAGAERIAVRAAERPDAGAGGNAHVDTQRPRRQPRRLEAGAAPGHVPRDAVTRPRRRRSCSRIVSRRLIAAGVDSPSSSAIESRAASWLSRQTRLAVAWP